MSRLPSLAVAAILAAGVPSLAFGENVATPAPRSGEAVGSGSSSAPMRMSEDELRKTLQAAGYRHVTDIRRDGYRYNAKARDRRGNDVTLAVDDSGRIERRD
jgi:hypothetical protein